MTFQYALKTLGIEDYAQRILSSNSHGELFHVDQYITLAKTLKGNTEWFRKWFDHIVELAEETWERPESVFQHVLKILIKDLK
jgi:hypothetical protein